MALAWRALIPKSSECTNLITPTCPCSSYVAYGAIRILPTFMILGQSAGCNAALAIDGHKIVQEINYQAMRAALVENGQIQQIPGNWLEIITLNN